MLLETTLATNRRAKKKTPTSTALSGVKVIRQPLPVLLLKRLNMLASMLKGMRHDLLLPGLAGPELKDL
jgi:hypothetical protein